MHIDEQAPAIDKITNLLNEDRIDPALLLTVTYRLAAAKSLDEQLQGIIELVCEVTDADRGSIWLNDFGTGELYTHITLGTFQREVRMLNTSGIAGTVFTQGKGLIILDPYADPRFNKSVDELTGYETKSILVAPIRTVKGRIMGVVQCLNKQDGVFTEADCELLEAIATQTSIALQDTLRILETQQLQKTEAEFLDVVADVSSEIQLGPLLQKIMAAITKMLDADRSTLFLNDERTGELYTEIGQGLGATQIRFPNHVGIAGNVFSTGETVNIPYAYADLRFNPAFDKRTGYFTRSILCVPVTNKQGKRIGVTQVLNKRGGAFTDEDEARLKAFTAQISIGLENAKLFDDVQRMKNYNESILESTPNGIITLDGEGRIVTCNGAGLRILGVEEAQIIGTNAAEFFTEPNAWVLDKISQVAETQTADVIMDVALTFGEETVSANLTTLPLRSQKDGALGTMLLIEDISNEMRVKSTMARYMDPAIADRLLKQGQEVLGGTSQEATILFSDIVSFTTLTEELGAQGTVALLNEYFTLMVECITREGGMLDKFIGDAIMAVFGIPVAHDDDEDRAVRAAVSMIAELNRYNKERVGHGKRPVDMRIGLNTDTVVSGNIGSPKRMDFTVIGDGVNLAARLESAGKTYATRILISEYTFNKLRGTYRTREVDRVVVKGKTQPVGIYEVLDYHTEDSFPQMTDVIHRFREGLSFYRQQRWDDAIRSFEAALAHHPADRASALYVDRCTYFKNHPPAQEWDGVWVMTTK